MKLYQEYLMERQGLSTIENEFGFVAFRFSKEECYLGEIFISQSARRSRKGRALLQEVEICARKASCQFIAANVFSSDPNATSTLSAAFACGFKIRNCVGGVIVIEKKLEN